MDHGPVSHNANAEQSLSFPVPADSQHHAWYQNTLVCCCLRRPIQREGVGYKKLWWYSWSRCESWYTGSSGDLILFRDHEKHMNSASLTQISAEHATGSIGFFLKIKMMLFLKGGRWWFSTFCFCFKLNTTSPYTWKVLPLKVFLLLMHLVIYLLYLSWDINK